jgi:outer membrane protein OmpA-like peptidoglycan-associated protein
MPLLRPILVLSALAAAAETVTFSTAPQAFSYPFTRGSALIAFRGTALDPGASGEASVRGEGNRMRIHAHFKGLKPAERFGTEGRTYVLWSVTPGGRCANLGEVAVRNGAAHVEAVTPLQTFALVVTAEPHFAVSRMGGAVVLENAPRRGGRRLETVEAKLDLLPREPPVLTPGQEPEARDPREVPCLRQARAAVDLARRDEAETYAAREFQAAESGLRSLEGGEGRRREALTRLARRVVQDAEDAREVALARKEAHARAEAKERAEEAQAKAEEALTQAQVAEARAEAAQSEAARQTMRADVKEREARKATDVQLALRRKLMEQMGRLLQTRETAEGLQATLTDVAFASGRSALTAASRENLAKVGGILLAHPNLRVKVVGHADATGRAEFNSRLSRDRAEAARSYLMEQGLRPDQIQAEGAGSSQPIASNQTPEGRRRNRRVDLLVTGEPIGL